MKNRIVLKGTLAFLLLQFLFVGCKSEVKDVSIPPEGYSSDATLKIAYASGSLELIETEFPIPNELKEYKDVVYKTIDSIDLKLDIYHLKNISQTSPLIIFVHGGSWKKGNKDDYLRYLVDYAKKGYVTATVQYRLTPVATYTEMITDIEDAVRWLKKNADNYHIDKNKVATVGGSAGAHLVMMNAFTNPPKKVGLDSISSNVQAVVNFYGPTDLTADYAKENPAVTSLIGKSYSEDPNLYKEASPLFFVSKNVPPTITFHGTLDELVPYEQADQLHEALQNAGAISDYHLLQGWPHTMDASVKVNAYAQHHIDAFFEKYIPKP